MLAVMILTTIKIMYCEMFEKGNLTEWYMNERCENGDVKSMMQAFMHLL